MTHFKLNVDYLHTNELSYELEVRGLEVPETASARRRLLRGILKQEFDGRSTISFIELEFDNEKIHIEETIKDLTIKINSFSGTSSDVEFNRLIHRLTHVSNRVARLSCTDDSHEQSKKKYLQEILSLEGELDMKSHAAPAGHSTPNQPILSASQFQFSKPVPVHKWNIHFSGSSGESVVGFLEKVECLRIARGVSDIEIFSSAADLFKDKAFTWYFNNKNKFNSWTDLVSKLKSDFLPYNYQEDLLEEIKARKQTVNEKVTLYINAMNGLFNRLENKPEEKAMVRIIQRNLLPSFIQPLALLNIESVDDLTEKCKRLEESLIWSQNSHTFYHRKTNLLEPDLGAPGTSGYRSVSVISSNIKCWNCNKTGHSFNSCYQPRKLFCYGCGKPEITKSKCPNCSKNGIGSVVSLNNTPTPQPKSGKLPVKKGKNQSDSPRKNGPDSTRE